MGWLWGEYSVHGRARQRNELLHSSVSDRIAFAYSSSRNWTAHVPSGEKAGRGPPCRRAVRSLQSGLRMKYCGIRACFAHFAGTGGGISLQLRLAGGGRGIRTLGTGVSPYNGLAIVCALTMPNIRPLLLRPAKTVGVTEIEKHFPWSKMSPPDAPARCHEQCPVTAE